MLETHVTDPSAPRDGELCVAGRADYPNPYLRQGIESFCCGVWARAGRIRLESSMNLLRLHRLCVMEFRQCIVFGCIGHII